MQQQGSVARRLEAAFTAFNRKDYETCLIHLFPALDKTAKKRRSKAKVGERICKYIEEDEDLLSYIALDGTIVRNINIGDMTVPKALYLYGRCPIAHEGELDPRLKITEKEEFIMGGNWTFPTSYIFALMISVLLAPENKDEFFVQNFQLSFCQKTFKANELWGLSNDVRQIIGLTDRNNRLTVV